MPLGNSKFLLTAGLLLTRKAVDTERCSIYTVLETTEQFLQNLSELGRAMITRRSHDLAVSTCRKRLGEMIAAPRPGPGAIPTIPLVLLGIGAPFEWIYDFLHRRRSDIRDSWCLPACRSAFFREKVLHIRVPSAHSEATDKALAVVISFTGLVLAFSLVQAMAIFGTLNAGGHRGPQYRSVWIVLSSGMGTRRSVLSGDRCATMRTRL